MQVLQQKPDVDVRISDVMRALFHGRAPRVSGAGTQSAFETTRPPAVPAVAGWQPIVLRCDGSRPIRFAGLPLLSMTRQTCDGGRLLLALFLEIEGELYAHCTITPSLAIAARVMMIGQRIDGADAMADFLAVCSPDASIRPCPGTDARLVPDRGEAAAHLQRSFDDLIADCLPRSRNQSQRSNPCP